MKRSIVYGMFVFGCFVVMAMTCTPLPTDSSENQVNASVEPYFPNGIPTAEQGKECEIGLKIGQSHQIDSIEISSSCNEYYQVFPLVSDNMYDTLYFTPVFETEGYCTLYVRASLNSETEDLENHLVMQVLSSETDTFLSFSTIPTPFTTHTGATDTLLFTLDHSGDVAYTLGCTPELDSTELHVAASADSGTTRVYFDPENPGDYTVTLSAEAGTHSAAATVAITVLPSFTPLSVEHPDTILTNTVDTIIYMLSPEQAAQGMGIGVAVDQTIVCGTIGVIPAGSDSVLVMVGSPTEGTLTFYVVTTTETFSDTLTRTLTFVDEISAAWGRRPVYTMN